MICLGMDPDTFNTGIAVVEVSSIDHHQQRGGPVKLPPNITQVYLGAQVLYATTVASDPKRGVEWRLSDQGRGIAEALRDIMGGGFEVDRAAVECMRHYTGKTKVRPQDLIHLNEIAGCALGATRVLWPDALVWDPKPQQWKGTISKPVHQRRVLRQVSLTTELLGVPGTEDLTPKQKGHIIDAIGLALKVADHRFPASLR